MSDEKICIFPLGDSALTVEFGNAISPAINKKAIALATDIPKLASIRQHLRSEMEQSPLMDEIGFTRAVEQAYRQMWQQWCAP